MTTTGIALELQTIERTLTEIADKLDPRRNADDEDTTSPKLRAAFHLNAAAASINTAVRRLGNHQPARGKP